MSGEIVSVVEVLVGNVISEEQSEIVVTQVTSEAVLEIEGQQGPVGPAGPQGPQGIQGPKGDDYHHTHEQAVADSVWTIVHNFGRIPKVTVIDSAGDEVEGDNSYPNLNTLIITFSAPFGGFAYLS